jgi:hypothetical protein
MRSNNILWDRYTCDGRNYINKKLSKMHPHTIDDAAMTNVSEYRAMSEYRVFHFYLSCTNLPGPHFFAQAYQWPFLKADTFPI